MFIVLHIIIALSSVLYASLLFLHPTKRNFVTSYILIGMTFVSGIYLVVSTHSPLLSSCIAGLAYLAAVSVGLAIARYRVAKEKISH